MMTLPEFRERVIRILEARLGPRFDRTTLFTSADTLFHPPRYRFSTLLDGRGASWPPNDFRSFVTGHPAQEQRFAQYIADALQTVP